MDDLEKTISAAVDTALTGSAPETAAPSTAEAPPADPAPSGPSEPPAGERARGADGKFIEKPAAAEKKPDAPAETATGAQAAGATPAVGAQSAKTTIAPPANWKGNGKVEWNRLPAHIQKEIADDYTRLSQTDGELSRIKSAIGDRASVLAATYGSVEQGLQNLFAISDMATKNPAQFIAWFAQQRGIDLGQLVQGSAQGAQPMQDAQHPLVQELIGLRNTVQQMQQSQYQATVGQLQTEIDSFAQDQAHPYFNDVRPDMSALLQAGRAKTLQEAYDMAVWAHPEVRQSLIAKEREAVISANAAKVATARQAAGGSLTGSPAGAQVPDDKPKRTLDDTIRDSVDHALRAS